jgi:hypothetical protein
MTCRDDSDGAGVVNKGERGQKTGIQLGKPRGERGREDSHVSK